VQIAEQEILVVVASLVHCCAIRKSVIVASQKRCCQCAVHSRIDLSRKQTQPESSTVVPLLGVFPLDLVFFHFIYCSSVFFMAV